MAAVKNVLKHVRTEVAGRKRKCYRNKNHTIVKGETCLVLRDGPQNESTYCAVCAVEILAKADELLAELHGQFGTSAATEAKGSVS
ncbi:MAG TPA: hypothetical protein VFJ97_14055 [Dermatophilaceae bacterium]|nr:hypothetical protein [Dermatophilaceae bacterium]